MERTTKQLETELELAYESARFERWHMIQTLPPGHRINDARLGLPAALRSGAGRHVDEGEFQALEPDRQGPVHRKTGEFVSEVLDTYFLFTEISERLQGIVKGSQEPAMVGAGACAAAVGTGSRSGGWVEV